MQAIKFGALLMILFSSTTFCMEESVNAAQRAISQLAGRNSATEQAQPSSRQTQKSEDPTHHWFRHLGPHLQKVCAAPDWWSRDARVCRKLKAVFLAATYGGEGAKTIRQNVLTALDDQSLDDSAKTQEIKAAETLQLRIWQEHYNSCYRIPRDFKDSIAECEKSIAQKWGFKI